MKRFGAMAVSMMVLAACSSTNGAPSHRSGPVIASTTTPAVNGNQLVDSSGAQLPRWTGASAGKVSTGRTRVLSVRPVNASGTLADGYHVQQTFTTISSRLLPGGCFAGSAVATAAYRCFATTNAIFDPCWAQGSSANSVLCLASPWSTTVTRLRLSGVLDPLPRRGPAVEPWGLQLSNRWNCVAGQGTHDRFNARVVFYDCGAWSSGRVVLLDINRSQPLWRAQTADRSAQGAYRMGPIVGVVTAWYAAP